MSDDTLDHRVLDACLGPLVGARHWYVGFSGGVDSSVLLALIQRWCKAHGGAPALSAIHINHGLQSSAADWQLHCEWVCKILQIDCLSLPVVVPAGDRGPEAAAREARYRAFESVVGPGDVLFLGHHLDDQVETFFLRLMRGAGLTGLAAMPASRSFGAARLERPLLQVSRQELEAYARREGLQWVEDPTNADILADRNFLRQQLLPLMASRWPAYRQTVTRASGHLGGAAEILERLLPAPPMLSTTMGDPGIVRQALLEMEADAAALSLRNWLRRLGKSPPDNALLREFLRQLTQASAEAAPLLDCGDYALQCYRDGVHLLPEPRDFVSPGVLTLATGERYEVPGLGLVGLEPAPEAGLSLAGAASVELRWRIGGERCTLVGRDGSRSLKKLLQEAHVPPWWRSRIPLLYVDGELQAAGGLPALASTRYRPAPAPGEPLWRLTWQRDSSAACD